jgi:acylaminoacyl-peptidase
MTTKDTTVLTSAIDTYRYYAGQPILTNIESCRQDSSGELVQLTSHFSTMDLVKLEDVTFTRSLTYSLTKRQVLFTSPVTPINRNLVRRLVSPDGQYVASVTKESKGEQELQYVNIWHDEQLIFAYDINDSKVSPHGKILPKNDYASFFQWSPDSRRLVFTAEEKRKPLKSYFTAEKLDDVSDLASAYRENWGEQMETFETCIICVIDLDSKQVKVIENQPKDLYFGQCTWTNDSNELILVAFRQEPYRLGLIYCENRASALFKCHWRDHQWTQLTEFDQYCRLFPRYLVKHDHQFVYLQCDINRAHKQCQRLILFDSQTRQEKILIDRVDNVVYADTTSAPFQAQWDEQFKGIYMSLPVHCYSSDGRYLLIRSLSGSRALLFIYDFIESKLVSLGSPLDSNVSVNGLAVFDHYVLVNVVDCLTPFRIYLFDLRTLNQSDKQQTGWHFIAQHQLNVDKNMSITWNLDRFFPDHGSIPVESIHVHAMNTQSKRPLIVLVHGGPNSNVFRMCSIDSSFP